MAFSVHPEAARRFSEEASALLKLLGPVSAELHGVRLTGSRAEEPAKASLTPDDMVDGQWVEYREDPLTGILSEVVFRTPLGDFGLRGDDAARLRQLAERAASRAELRDACGRPYVENHLLSWLRDARDVANPTPWVEALLSRLGQDVTDRAILMPITGMAIAEPLTVGRLRFGFFTQADLDRSMQAIREAGKLDEQSLAVTAERFDEYRGVVYARFACTAEPGHAKELALQEAERVLAYLRFFHPAALDARAHCPLGRTGGQSPHEFHYLEEKGGIIGTSGSEARRWGADFDLTSQRFRKVVGPELALLNQFLNEPEPTEIQIRLLQAITLYSAGLLFERVEQRLLHALVALESLLLKNESEPILFSLTLRAAHMIGKSADERRAIRTDLGEAYRLRSDFVHHGRETPSERIPSLNRGIRRCWSLLDALLNDQRVATKELRTKEQMLEELDELILT